jgi:hypothetical protein
VIPLSSSFKTLTNLEGPGADARAGNGAAAPA